MGLIRKIKFTPVILLPYKSVLSRRSASPIRTPSVLFTQKVMLSLNSTCWNSPEWISRHFRVIVSPDRSKISSYTYESGAATGRKSSRNDRKRIEWDMFGVAWMPVQSFLNWGKRLECCSRVVFYSIASKFAWTLVIANARILVFSPHLMHAPRVLLRPLNLCIPHVHVVH